MRCWEVKRFSGLSGLGKIADDLDLLDCKSVEHYDYSTAAIRNYVSAFGSDDSLEIVTVYEGSKLRAALPVLIGRSQGLFADATNLANQWLPGRFAAFDASNDAPELARHLLHGLRNTGVSSLMADWVNSEGVSLNAFLQCSQEDQLKSNRIPKFECGKITLKKDWDEFTKHWSKSRRKFIRKAENRLSEQGPLYAVAVHQLDFASVLEYFDECLKIEDGSWKGERASSLLKNAPALQFFRNSMRDWYAKGQLRLWVMKSNGRPIAFDFGYARNGVACSIKISYLNDYADFSPGHLLNASVVRDLMADPSVNWIDTLGPLIEANRKWCETSYTCQKLELALPGWLNNGRVQVKGWARTIKRVAERTIKINASGQAASDGNLD